MNNKLGKVFETLLNIVLLIICHPKNDSSIMLIHGYECTMYNHLLQNIVIFILTEPLGFSNQTVQIQYACNVNNSIFKWFYGMFWNFW